MAQIWEQFDVVAFKKGDRKTFADLYKQLFSAIYVYCHNISEDELHAEEATAHAFTQLWEARHKFETATHVKNFLYQVARNRYLTLIRTDKDQHVISTDPIALAEQLAGKEIPADADIIRAELAHQNQWELILHEIDQLPGEYAQIIRMRFIEGVKVKDIAAHFNQTPKQITDKLHHGKKILQKRLGGKGPSVADLAILLTLLKLFIK